MILFGASGHCKSVIDIAESVGEKIGLIYDDNPKVVLAITTEPIPTEDQLETLAVL